MAKKKQPKPEPAIRWDLPNCIPELISQAIYDDCDYDSDFSMAQFYKKLSVREKAVADVALIKICGWSLQTLLLCVKQKLPPGEVDGRLYDKYNPFTLLDGDISDDDLKPKSNRP
jgi:hypothetical protein